MNSFAPHWPAFRTGLLMHLTVGVVLLAAAVVVGPPLAWLLGQEFVSVVVAAVAVLGRALVGYGNARSLWRASAQPRTVLISTAWAGLVGYLAVFFPLAGLGMWASPSLLTAVASTGLAVVLDCVLMLMATAAGALIAASSKRRRRRRLLDPSGLPVVRDIVDSFAKHRAQTRLDI